MSESNDPLARAIELSIEFESAEGEKDVETFLAQHEDLRDILEPLIRPEDAPDERTVLGDYELVRELGRGGMGVVYEAIQTLLGRTVALKLLPPHRALSPRSLAMFRREATLAASLAHPGIAKVHDFQEIDGQLALAMELIDGMPLDDVLSALGERAPGTVTTEDLARAAGMTAVPEGWHKSYEHTVVELARQMAEALAHAHSRGIVHRDVKPGNILMTPEGRVVLTDFGLAKEEGMLGMTRTGEFAGTYQYAAPEQLEGRLDELDGRTDIYALGATLYEMLTLKRPLEAESLSELVLMIRREDPAPPSRHNGRIGSDLEAVVLCSLEKERSDRYDTAEDFATDLRNVIEGRPVLARRLSLAGRTGRWIDRNRFVAVFVAMLVVSVVGVTVLAISTARAEAKAKNHLDRYENIWAGRAMENVIDRASRAHPAWPEQVKELSELVRLSEEQILTMRDSQRRAIAELRGGNEFAAAEDRHESRLAHPAAARLALVRGLIERTKAEAKNKEANATAKAWAAAEVAALEKEARELAALVTESNRVQIANPKAQALHDRLEDQLFQLRHFENNVLADLRFRVEWAKSIRERSIDAYQKQWEGVAQRVAANKVYSGLTVVPQLGLVPLGPDSETGLEEFAHLMSGAVPVRGEKGELSLTEEHAIVFVLIPAGELNTRVTKNVRLDAFFAGKHEVSRAQWERMARGLPGLRLRDGGVMDVRNFGEMHKPANGVSWNMCREVLARGGLEIPTTCQWERLLYYGFVTQTDLHRVANVRDRAYKKFCEEHGKTSPRVLGFDDGHARLDVITGMEPTPGGIHHLLGNVAEWCRDVYSQEMPQPRDGDGLREALATKNALRLINGGHWLDLNPSRMFDRFSPHAAKRAVGIRASRALQVGASK